MDVTTTNTALALGGYTFSALLAVCWWLMQRDVSKNDKAIERMLHAIEEDAANLESWKLEYVKGHAEVEGEIAVLQNVCAEGVKQLQVDSRASMITLATLTNKLDNLDRLVRLLTDREPYQGRRRDEA